MDVNPNSKIPALMDRSGPKPIRVFETGAILVYLAEKFGAFLPTETAARAECLSWLFWQMGSAPYLGGGFGHFYAYAPTKIEYAIDRFAMETKRQLDVLDKRLGGQRIHCGCRLHHRGHCDLALVRRAAPRATLYGAGEFLAVQEYTHVQRWTETIAKRPAAKRGRMVNRTFGEPSSQLHERHDAGDFDTKTQDKISDLGLMRRPIDRRRSVLRTDRVNPMESAVPAPRTAAEVRSRPEMPRQFRCRC